ncbi:unnamed protein product [Allacma fusca]|uniref:Uncharacterized protein n=1 Tax=Allacma fusca TaxID=39272 RepID=A0A8J2LLZ5_9HEXA|nr:unnamed protein product [Allacma fusca]
MSQQSGSGQSCSEDSTESQSGSTSKPKSDFGKKHRKLVRILTVIAYIISVSTAAVLLSAYYVFLWKPATSSSATESPTTLAMLLRNLNDITRCELYQKTRRIKEDVVFYEQHVNCPKAGSNEKETRSKCNVTYCKLRCNKAYFSSKCFPGNLPPKSIAPDTTTAGAFFPAEIDYPARYSHINVSALLEKHALVRVNVASVIMGSASNISKFFDDCNKFLINSTTNLTTTHAHNKE